MSDKFVDQSWDWIHFLPPETRTAKKALRKGRPAPAHWFDRLLADETQRRHGGLTSKSQQGEEPFTRRCRTGENAGKPGPCPGPHAGTGTGGQRNEAAAEALRRAHPLPEHGPVSPKMPAAGSPEIRARHAKAWEDYHRQLRTQQAAMQRHWIAQAVYEVHAGFHDDLPRPLPADAPAAKVNSRLATLGELWSQTEAASQSLRSPQAEDVVQDPGLLEHARQHLAERRQQLQAQLADVADRVSARPAPAKQPLTRANLGRAVLIRLDKVPEEQRDTVAKLLTAIPTSDVLATGSTRVLVPGPGSRTILETLDSLDAPLHSAKDNPEPLWEASRAPIKVAVTDVPAQARGDTSENPDEKDVREAIQYRRLNRHLYVRRDPTNPGAGGYRIVPAEKVPPLIGVPARMLEGKQASVATVELTHKSEGHSFFETCEREHGHCIAGSGGGSSGSDDSDKPAADKAPAPARQGQGKRARRVAAFEQERAAWEARSEAREQRRREVEDLQASTYWDDDRARTVQRLDPDGGAGWGSGARESSAAQRADFRERARQWASEQSTLFADVLGGLPERMTRLGLPDKAAQKVREIIDRARPALEKAAQKYLKSLDRYHAILDRQDNMDDPPEAPDEPQDDEPAEVWERYHQEHAAWEKEDAAWIDRRDEIEEKEQELNEARNEAHDAVEALSDSLTEKISDAVDAGADKALAAIDREEEQDAEPEEPDWNEPEPEAEQAAQTIEDNLTALFGQDLSEEEDEAAQTLDSARAQILEDPDEDETALADYLEAAKEALSVFSGAGNAAAARLVRQTILAAQRALRALGPEQEAGGEHA